MSLNMPALTMDYDLYHDMYPDDPFDYLGYFRKNPCTRAISTKTHNYDFDDFAAYHGIWVRNPYFFAMRGRLLASASGEI